MKEKHINFQVTKCGTFINQQYPWLHVTPDFLCRCDCCGDGFDARRLNALLFKGYRLTAVY